MIAKQLTGTGLIWTHYLQTCIYAYNGPSPALNGLSPFQLNYSRPPQVLLQIETIPQGGIVRSFKD